MSPTPTADQLDQFERDGHFTLEGLFSDEECDRVVGLLEGAQLDLRLGDPEDGPLTYRPMLHLDDSALRSVATDPRWADVVLPIVGPSARLLWEQGVAKEPMARTELPWHQDNGYAPTVPAQYLTCWLALDDADEDNGCLWVRLGSHTAGPIGHHGTDGPFRSGYDGDDPGVPVPVAKGSVLVFSSLMLHRSGPNTSDRHRRAWILQYCPADAVHARTQRLLDDRLLVASDGEWLAEPVRERPIDLMEVYANYESD